MILFLDDSGGATDPYFSSVRSLIHFDDANGTIFPVDVKGKTWTAGADAVVSTSSPLTGSGSGLLDGTADHFSTPDHADFELGSGDFTIEIDVRFASLPAASGAMALVSKYLTPSDLSYFFYLFNSAGTYRLYFTYSTNGSASTNVFVNWTPSTATKYKLTVERNGANLRFYVDGVQQGSTQAVAGTFYNGNAVLRLGGTPSSGAAYPLNGKIDEFRLTVGVARYVGNYTPVEPFPDS